MTDAPLPPEGVGINVLRLDADRTRDKLTERLGEIEARLSPRELAKSASLTVQENRKQFLIAGGAAVVAVAGIITLVVRSKRG